MLSDRRRHTGVVEATVLFILFTDVSFRQVVIVRRYFLNLFGLRLGINHGDGVAKR